MFRSVAVELSAKAGPFLGAMGAAGAAMKEFGGTVNAASSQVQAATKQMGAALASVGVAAIALAAVSAGAAAGLETRMQNVATIWTDTSLSVQQAGKGILEMSTRLPQSANVLAEGLYQVASSGFQGADAMNVLNAAGTAASAGLTTTATAAKGITAVLNAYGLGADQATRVSDVLFQTVNLGVVNFEELSGALGNFIGTAAAAKITIEEAAAAYATMTLSGLNADEASTSLNRTLQAFIQPGKEMSAVLQQMGYNSGVAALQTEGLRGISEHLAQVVGRDNVAAFAVLFPEMRGLRGELALLAAGGENYSRVSEGMAQAAGATRAALEEQSKSASYQFGILKNTVMTTAVTFGQALLPAIKVAIAVIQALADVFGALPGPIQVAVVAGVVLTGIAVGLFGAFVLLAPAIAAVPAALSLLAAGFGVATGAVGAFLAIIGPVGWIVAAVGVAVAAATALWARHAKQQAENKREVDALKDSLVAETGAAGDSTNALIAKKIVQDDLDKKARSLGLSLDVLAKAMTGDAAAAKEVGAATRGAGKDGEALRDAVKNTSRQFAEAQDALHRDALAKGAAASATRKLSAEQEAAIASSAALAAASQNLAKNLAAMFDPKTAATSAAATAKDAEDKRLDAAKEGLRKRHELDKQALDETQQAEKRSADRLGDQRKRTLDQAHADEMRALELDQRVQVDALDARQRLVTDALAEEARARKDALDRVHRDQKEALDRQFRDEKDALDARLGLLADGYDRRRKEEERRFEAEKADVQAMIDSTFGVEREGWKDRLRQVEDAHDDRLNEIDHAEENESKAVKNALDDRQQAVKDALDDRQKIEDQALSEELDTIKRNLQDQYDAEKRTLQDRYDQRVRQAKDRQDVEKTALETELVDLQDNLGRRQQAITTHLQDVQRAEDAAADERRTTKKTKDELRLGDLQTELNNELVAQKQMIEDLKTIVRRGGSDVNAIMLEELQKLPPTVIAQLAAAGPAAFDRFLATFKQGMADVNVLDIINAARPTGDALAQGMIQGWYQRFATTPVVGSLLQGVKIPGYAEGHYADIAMSGPRLWAEPETGGESYIPLAPSKRARSVGILGLTAAHFGFGLTRMADGGIIAPAGPGGGGVTLNIDVENHLAPGIDMGVAGQVIQDAVERGVSTAVDGLERRIGAKAWRR